MMPGMAAYAASKAGVEQFANCLRLEVAHKGVKVGSVHPGWIDTDLVRDQRKRPQDVRRGVRPLPVAAERDHLRRGLRRRHRATASSAAARRVYVPKRDRARAGAADAHHRRGRQLADPAGETKTLVPADGGRDHQARPLLRRPPAWRCRRRRPPRRRPSRRSDGDGGDPRPAAAGHRARITGGLAAAIAEKGYAAVTIADVVRHARVSKRTFYEHFADKEACFLALYAETSDELLALIAATAANVAGPWDERLGAAARAYFERVAAEPELIRAALLEIQAAGPRARELRRDVQRRYAELLRTLSIAAAAEEDGIRALSPALATAVVGGLNELMLEAVEAGQAARMGELAAAATELIRAVLAR